MKKKLLFGIAFIFVTIMMFAQPMMQASLGQGSNSNRVKVYIKPVAPVAGTISTLQFDVAIESSVTPVPALSIVGTPSFGLTWFIDPSYTESGFRHYQFTTAISPFINIPATDTLAFEVEFSGGPAGVFPIYLVTLPEGGATGNALFLCTGAANSVSGQLYYPRTGVTVVNNDSYNPGGGISYAMINGIALPIEILDFTVYKENHNGILYWNISDHKKINHFEVERSFDGIRFDKISILPNNNTNLLSYLDENIDALKTNNVYYKIKIIEKSGEIVYSPIRVLNTDYEPIIVKIFPNPTHEFITVQSSELSNIKEAYLQNTSGQNIHLFSFENNNGWSKTLDLSSLNLISGIYNLLLVDKNGKHFSSKIQFIQLD